MGLTAKALRRKFRNLNNMSKIKVIKTEKDYEDALRFVGSLMSHNSDPNSDEGERLNLLSTLIEDYEAREFPRTFPDPIEAIKFRMEQSDLKPADLIPYIGSRSRVSDILSGKRQLTLEMVRALELGLGIPAKVLIKKPSQDENLQYENWNSRLLKEMGARGYFGNASLKEGSPVELLKKFFSSVEPQTQMVGMLRKTNYRSSPLTDRQALSAWSVRILQKAKKIQTPVKYKHGTIDINFMQKIAKLSANENSPVLAQEHLKKIWSNVTN